MKKIEKIEMTKTAVTNEDIKKYKDTILNIMKDFHDFLTSHDIKYSLDGGSLLGAIRHNGFIPWDDDIDIILVKDEYNKLLKVINEFNSDKYLVLTPLEDNPLTFPRGIKIYDKRCCTKEYGVVEHSGPFIDVFTTIDINSEQTAKKEADKYRLLTTLYMFKINRVNTKTYLGGHSYIMKILSLLISKKKLVKEIKKYYERNDSNICLTSFGSSFNILKSTFNEYETHKFEQYEFNIIKNYDYYLTRLYGDYMTPPPVEKQNQHHLISISFNESFIDKNRKNNH